MPPGKPWEFFVSASKECHIFSLLKSTIVTRVVFFFLAITLDFYPSSLNPFTAKLLKMFYWHSFHNYFSNLSFVSFPTVTQISFQHWTVGPLYPWVPYVQIQPTMAEIHMEQIYRVLKRKLWICHMVAKFIWHWHYIYSSHNIPIVLGVINAGISHLIVIHFILFHRFYIFHKLKI